MVMSFSYWITDLQEFLKWLVDLWEIFRYIGYFQEFTRSKMMSSFHFDYVNIHIMNGNNSLVQCHFDDMKVSFP